MAYLAAGPGAKPTGKVDGFHARAAHLSSAGRRSGATTRAPSRKSAEAPRPTRIRRTKPTASTDRRRKHARVCQGVLLQGERADDSRQCLQSVVARRLLAERDRPRRRNRRGRPRSQSTLSCGRSVLGGKTTLNSARSTMKYRLVVATIFVAVPLATVLARAQTTATPAKASQSGLDLAMLDRGADPCGDFYAYACGGWTKNQPIPADRSAWGVAERLQDENETRLRRILDAAATGRDPAEKKIGDYYATCMDESRIDAAGAAALDPTLKKIAALAERPGAAGARRGAAHDRRQRLLQLRRRSRLQGREPRARDRRSGRSRPAGPRLLLPRRCGSRSSCGNNISSTSAGCSR